MATMFDTKVWRILRRHGPLRPKAVQELVFHRWRKPSRESVRRALVRLRSKGCITCWGASWERVCQATPTRPINMKGKSPGSAIGRAIANEITRQEARRDCGVIPAGTALERAWPLFPTNKHDPEAELCDISDARVAAAS